ncbi:MAG: divergent polysaccharide deacetylase family protein [Coprothermobacterota bacterium]|nr:divergent polysaccharide deacetylase family protein [Coprothermobacterota bacterium]
MPISTTQARPPRKPRRLYWYENLWSNRRFLWAFLALLVVAGVVLWITLPATSAGPRSTIQLLVDTPSIVINGLVRPLDSAPFIENGRTWAPLRFVSESLAAQVDWDDATQTITITQRGRRLRIAIGSNELVIQGNLGSPQQSWMMDVAPFLRYDRTWAPVRFISEALDAEVTWSETNRSVTLSFPGELGLVTQVDDPRTFQAQLPDGPFTVRLLGIRPPEPGEEHYAESLAAMKALVEGKVVFLEKDTTLNDPEGRLLRWAFLGDETVNGMMVRQGEALAATQSPDTLYAQEMLVLEQEARQGKTGFWAPPPPPPPPTPSPSESPTPTPSDPPEEPPTPSPAAIPTSFRFAIVIDDFGYNMFEAEPFLNSPDPITIAVLPGVRHSSEISNQAIAKGKEVILHCPMENALGVNETVLTSMNEEEVAQRLEKNLLDTPGAVGVSNHMGSIATADERTMRFVLTYVKSRNLFFFDSRTTRDSVVLEMAAQVGARALANKVFLDNENDPSYVRGQLAVLHDIVLRDGSAVAIGHTRTDHLADLIREAVIAWQAEGLQMVPLSQLMP